MSIPRFAHQKFVPYLFPILSPRPRSSSILSTQSAIRYTCLIGNNTKCYVLRGLRGSINSESIAAHILPLAILSYPLTTPLLVPHMDHLGIRTSVQIPVGTSILVITARQRNYLFFRLLPFIASYPTRIIKSFVHTAFQHS